MNTFSTNILTQDKENFARIINNAFKQMGNTKFLNKDFREVLKNLNFPHGNLDKVNCFIYADTTGIGNGFAALLGAGLSANPKMSLRSRRSSPSICTGINPVRNSIAATKIGNASE